MKCVSSGCKLNWMLLCNTKLGHSVVVTAAVCDIKTNKTDAFFKFLIRVKESIDVPTCVGVQKS